MDCFTINLSLTDSDCNASVVWSEKIPLAHAGECGKTVKVVIKDDSIKNLLLFMSS